MYSPNASFKRLRECIIILLIESNFSQGHIQAVHAIIKYIGKYNNFTFPNCDYGRFRVFTNNHAPGGALYAFSPTASSIHIIGKSYLLDTHTKRLAFG